MDPKKLYYWLDGVETFSGEIPGTSLVIQLTKNEKGLTGSVLGHTFKDYPQVNLAVALGAIVDVRGLQKAESKPMPLADSDPLFGQHAGIQHHATYHDYSFLLPEPLKLSRHRLILDQPKGVDTNRAFLAPAVHLVGPDHRIIHNHVWDHGKGSFDGQYQAQATGTTQAVQAAFQHHLGSQPAPSGPPTLKVVKVEPLAKEYRPRILTTGGPGGFIPKIPLVPTGEAEVKIDANRKQKPTMELKPTVGGARRINIPGLKPIEERPGPDNHIEAAENPKRPMLKVSKSLAFQACSVCRSVQIRNGKFTGCSCFSSMAKGVTIKDTPKAYELTFGPEWDQDAILALNLAFKGS